MFSLTHLRLSPLALDAFAWSLSSSGLLTIKSFFVALSNHSNPIPFLPTNFV